MKGFAPRNSTTRRLAQPFIDWNHPRGRLPRPSRFSKGGYFESVPQQISAVVNRSRFTDVDTRESKQRHLGVSSRNPQPFENRKGWAIFVCNDTNNERLGQPPVVDIAEL